MSAKFLSCSRRAFTIVELLVAVAVTAVLVTLMVTITINVLSAWNRSSGSLTAGNQARLVLDQLSQDLQSAIIRRDDNVWLAASLQGDQADAGDSETGEWDDGAPKAATGSLRINPPGVSASELENFGEHENSDFLLGIENYRFGQSGVWLRFFSTPSDNTSSSVENSSAPRAISYQMTRRRLGSDSSDEFVYTLYRSEVRPAATSGNNSTFGTGYDLLMSGGYNAPNVNSNVGDVDNVRSPTGSDIIANDVVDFGIKLYGRETVTLPSGETREVEVELFPVDRRGGGSIPAAVFAVTADTTKTDSFNSGTHAYGYPTAADVMLRILTPEGVRLIQAIENETLVADWWTTVIQNSQVYTRRIEIKSKGL